MSITEHASSAAMLGNVYDPKLQSADSPQQIIKDELSKFGEVVDIQGTVVRTPTQGILADGVKVFIQNRSFRLPIVLWVKWDQSEERFTYENAPVQGVDEWRFDDFLRRQVSPGRGGYDDVLDEASKEATRAVFARWMQHPTWQMTQEFEERRISYFEQLRWDGAVKDWNEDTRKRFNSSFLDSGEHGLFFERLMKLCAFHKIEEIKDFALVETGNHIPGRFGSRSRLSPFSPDASEAQFPALRPLVVFRARDERSWADLNMRYDGENLFAVAFSSSHVCRKVAAL